MARESVTPPTATKAVDRILKHTSALLSSAKAAYLSIAMVTVATSVGAMQLEGYYNFILATLAINVLVGVGLNILLGLSGQISFGHIGFFAIGAYAAGALMLQDYGFWFAFAAAGLLSGVVGVLLALPALRVTGPYLAMMTIAFAFIIEHGTIEWRALTGGSNGLMGFPAPEFFGHEMVDSDIALLAVLIAGIGLLFYQRLATSSWGRAMRAVRDSEVAAQSLGINPILVKTVSFGLSAFLTGLAGAMFAPLNMFISPSSFPFFQSILFVLAVVVGGAGTLWGPVLGAAIVVMLPEILSGYAEYRLLLFGGLLLGVLWMAPNGLIGVVYRLLHRENPAPANPRRRTLDDILGPRDPGGEGDSEACRLKVENIGISFGGIRAAQDVSFEAQGGQITSIIGPNGAGKTTVLNMICGFYRPDRGEVTLDRVLSGQATHRISRAGISRTYQTPQLFEHMSVLDNLRIALKSGRLGALLSDGDFDQERALAEDLLGFVGYRGPVERLAGNLPHVDKRLVEIARALATRPAVLLLDEPAAGLMHEDKAGLAELLRSISAYGIALILVEHDMSLVMGISDQVVVLDAGMPLMTGTPAEVREDKRVLEAYLGATSYQGRPRATAWNGEMLATLTAHDLAAGYGAAPVLKKVRLTVNPGEMVAVLGANGAGKSTMLRAISGLHRPVDGSILLNDEETAHRSAHEIAAAGMVLVPEGRQVFPELTLRDNILLGAWSRKEAVSVGEFEALLERFPRLRERIESKAGVLSGGEQQMLAIARGLIAKPEILLLDEPSLGLAPSMIAELFDALADLRDDGVTVLIVDQMANLALAIADRGYVLDNGAVVNAGAVDDLKNNPTVVQAYLGHAH